ncbi:ABC transporter substrate-binding protein [Shewanella surugensis]|uniref:ABC transporter substrate-binding protein n=1 Tax=Shewanella surugensis TaxID=212020 RepID=A0ABT0L8A6_9GAMM|nr:ABC transporter substrate-binding protein [Shewanella surugensis]MCL1123931.1 ABC transporter substrate-binding protein [Shewanella surugensis]
MKQRLQRLSYCITTLLVLLMLSGCERSNAPSGLVYCSEGNPESFNPQTTVSNLTTDATFHQIYNGLIDYKTVKGDMEGALAKNWNVSQDGLVYTFILRDDIHFHHTPYFSPTRSLNADDVVFSFNRVLDKNHPFHSVSITGYPFFESLAFSKRVKKIVKLDDYKVAFHLYQKDASFLSTLSSAHSIILSKEYANHLIQTNTPLRTIDWQPIGTGAFIFIEYLPNEYIRYRRNDDYWKKLPTFEQLIFNIFTNNIKRLSHFITNDCEVSALPKISDINYIRKNKDITIDVQEGHNLAYLAFNMNKPPLDDIRVRQAISYAINRKNLLHSVYKDTAREATNILPPSSWAFEKRTNNIHYNPIKAKKLLREAGLSQLKLNIWVQYAARVYNTDAEKMAVLIQADLNHVGIEISIIPFTWADFEHRDIQSYDTILTGWNATNTDPNDFFYPLFSCAGIAPSNNLSRWCDPTLDTLLDKARSIQDKVERKKLYQQAENRIESMYPILPIAHAKEVTLLNKSLSSSQINPYNGIAFENIHIKSSEGKH